jgi:hypothetical protein
MTQDIFDTININTVIRRYQDMKYINYQSSLNYDKFIEVQTDYYKALMSFKVDYDIDLGYNTLKLCDIMENKKNKFSQISNTKLITKFDEEFKLALELIKETDKEFNKFINNKMHTTKFTGNIENLNDNDDIIK